MPSKSLHDSTPESTETGVYSPPKSSSRPQITITVLAGLEQGQIHRIDRPTTTFGRSNTCEVILTDPLISRHHCQILLGMGGVTLKDLGSTHGTYLNGTRVMEGAVQNKDVISVGETRFRFAVDIVKDQAGSKTHKVDELAHKKLLALYEIGNLVNSVLELKTLLNIIMTMAIRALQANRGFLLIRQENGELYPIATHSLAPGEAQSPYSSTIVEAVLKEKTPVLVLDARQDARFGTRESLKNLPLSSAICVPLWEREKIIGVVYVDKAEGTSAFNEEDLYFLSTFANQAGVAIGNAK
jgi:pSer/pThr/pTyr-binding forkhead associated (FHA) protein/putative methionine-R-sulfoxide reductase with GAF domain